MKILEKFKKRPDEAAEKQPKVKNVLLQTYFTSLLCLVLSMSMFLGTSYAWFTSEVNNTANEIYIGTLDVGLEKRVMENETETWKSLSEISNDKKTTNLFDGSIRWEPGYTALETIRVVNEGDLAFNYVLNFTDGSVVDGFDANAKPDTEKKNVAAIAQYFDVWVKEGNAPNPGSYTAITAEDSGWEYAGSLDAVLDGKAVLDGTMETVRKEGQESKDINAKTTDGVATTDTYTIALHMKEDVGSGNDEASKLMGKKISLNVKLVAYQMVSETDGFNNSSYDDINIASDAAGLKKALATAGSTVLLSVPVEIENIDARVTMNGGVIDGNGQEITYSGGRNSDDGSVGVLTTYGGTIKNLTIDGGENGRALYVTKLATDLIVSGSTFSGAYAFNLNSATVTDYTMTFVDSTFKSWTSYANVMDHAYFTNCVFKAVLRPYGDTTLTNCTFTTEGLDVSELEDGETITLINCTYNGKQIEKEVLKAENGAIQKVEESGLLTVTDAKAVVLTQ